eukprot:1158239-Pelagomonas_calceolata.AAC.7
MKSGKLNFSNWFALRAPLVEEHLVETHVQTSKALGLNSTKWLILMDPCANCSVHGQKRRRERGRERERTFPSKKP